MKKVMKFCFISALAVFMLISCKTMNPVVSDVNFPADSSSYEVLGRVTVDYDAKMSGYTLLLEKAEEIYPETDDVVNIIVDVKATYFLFIPISASYTMSGIALDYK